MKKLLFFALLLVLTSAGVSQPIYGVWQSQNNVYYFSSNDPYTATRTDIAAISGMNGIIAPNNTVIRADSNWYIVRALMGSQYRLLTIDITTGSIVYNVAFPGVFVGFEYNEANDSIYCIYHDGNSDYKLATIDHVSGNYNLYPAISGVSAYVGGTFALDKASGLYTFAAYTSSYRLLSININTGAIAYNNPMPTGLIGVEYDCQTDSIYGLQNINDTYYLASINNINGASTIIDTVNGMNGIASYTASLDSWAGTYSVYGFVGSQSTLFHLDASTGAELSSSTISHNMVGYEGYETCNDPPPPIADFEADNTTIQAGSSVNFTDLSLFNPTSWSWQFQGASPATSTQQNPTSINYPTPGCYAVTLSASNSQGTGNEVKTCYITVIDSVEANLEASDTNLLVGDTINFTDLTSNTPTAWSWSFFPGGLPIASIAQHPQDIVYGSAGNFNVQLIASNSISADTLIKQEYIHVYDVPIADFVADDTVISVGDTVHFTDLSYGNIDAYSWSFSGGNPGNSALQNPSISYTTPGCYDVSLTVSNFAGTDTETKTCYIEVLDPPVESDLVADTLVVNPGGTVNFTDLSQHNPSNWNWSFQAGTPASSTQQHPQNIAYYQLGCWDVSLNATNASGGDTAIKVCYISVEEPQGLKPSALEGISIYPNPASSVVYINGHEGGGTFLIRDLKGRTVLRELLTDSKSSISLDRIKPGIYIIEVAYKSEILRDSLILSE